MSYANLMEEISVKIRKREPEILTTIGLTGMASAAIVTGINTPGALRSIDAKKDELETDKLNAVQIIKATWRYYIVPASTFTLSAVLLIKSNRIYKKRSVALATACTIAESTLRDYRNKVIETIGERKENQIQDSIDKDRIEQNPPPAELPAAEGNGKTLCFDSMFGRYFYSDIEAIRKAVNKVNYDMTRMSETYVSLNEFYSEIGLREVEVGDMLGWNASEGLIEVTFSSQLMNGRTPCLVMRFKTAPHYYFDYT